MSNKEISRYLTKEDGTTFSSDTELLGLSVNSKVKNKNSGYTFKKTGSNVFDKTPIEVETNAVLYTSQTLTDAQKTQARTNIGAGKAESVLYTAQTLTDAQKLQARTNIGISDLSGVPLGTIVIWSGNASSIPAGWHICDGNAGTPDLRQKFVLGAGGVYPLNSSGGAVDHFHFFGRHTGDNSGSFYVCGELHNDSEGTNTAQLVKSPRKEALLSALNFGTSSAVIIEDEIGPKTAMWNGDNGGGISDHDKFTRGNMITSRGYAAGTTAAEGDCMPPYYVLYYIMKITGSGSTASGGTAASATQVETLSNLITQLQARISVLESSSGSSGSSSSGGSGSLTLGNVETMTITLKYSTGSGIIGKKVKAGTILYGKTGYNGDTSYGFNAIEVTNGSYIVVEDSTITDSHTEGGSGSQGAYNIVTHSVKVRRITGVNV